MADFFQSGSITTLHDLGTVQLDQLESVLDESTTKSKIGLVLPVTAGGFYSGALPVACRGPQQCRPGVWRGR